MTRRDGMRWSGGLVAVVLATLAATPLSWAEPSGAPPGLGPDGHVAAPPFGVGERLTFEVKYGFLSAGTAVLGIPEVVRERGRLCYRIVSLAECHGLRVTE